MPGAAASVAPASVLRHHDPVRRHSPTRPRSWTFSPSCLKSPARTPPDYTRERGSTGFRWARRGHDADVLLALDGDQLVGLSSVYRDIESIRYGPRCWLQDLVVTHGAARQGIGGRCSRPSSAWAREHGCTHLELGSGLGRVDAHRFYEREGMTRGAYNFTLPL